MTPDEAKLILEHAKSDVANWEVVLNITHSDETVRDTVLFQLLKRFHKAAGGDGDVFRLPEESLEGAIKRIVLASTGSYYPSQQELEEVVRTALEHHAHWKRAGAVPGSITQ